VINPANNPQKDPNAAFLDSLIAAGPARVKATPSEVAAPQPDSKGEFACPADGAKFVAALGIPQTPLIGKNPSIGGTDWHLRASTDFAQIDEWARNHPGCNFGSVALAEIGKHFVLEADSPEVRNRHLADTKTDFPKTLKIQSRKGRGHRWYLQTAESIALGNIPQDNKFGDFSLRMQHEMTVSPGSIHPDTGKQYRVVENAPPVEAASADIAWLRTQKKFRTKIDRSLTGEKIPYGRHDATLFKIACSLRHDGLEEQGINACLVEVCEKRCEGYGDDYLEMCAKKAASACKYPPGTDKGVIFKNSAYGVPPAKLPAAESNEPEPVVHFSPKLSDDALYGIAGDIVKKIMPQTESHPAGLLVQILMYFGNIIGHTAYFQIESTRHYGNLFAVRVGVSSKARKGTGGDRINAVFEPVDPVWYSTRLRSGLSSSEGLIVAVGDQELDEDRNGHPVVIHGEVRDKRLVSYEGEFSQLLVVMQRGGNTISTNIRNAWDGKPLRTLTIKPRLATNHTISILGDITANEAKTKMTADDSTNGFANRFLWVHVERTKLLPFGGEEIDFGSSIDDLKKAIEFAQSQKRIFMDENARKMWSRAYERLSVAHDGLFGSVTSRSEAHVLRLALLYALMDRSDHIRSEHLHAALAFWQYCEDSARFIFDELTVEQQMIIEFLREHGSQTKTDLLKILFNRNRAAAEIAADLELLVRRGSVSQCRNKKSVTVYFVQGRKEYPVLPENQET
jgi:hypothetical protein